MTFLPEKYYTGLAPAPRAAVDRQFAEWSALRDAVVPFIGEHAAALFSHAIADEHSAGATSAHIRKTLTDTGDNPDDPMLTEAEQLLIEWARLIAREPAAIPAEFAARVESTFSESLRVLLVAFAAQTVAAHVIEAALATSLRGSAL